VGIVFLNIENRMLNMATAALIAAASGITLDVFMQKEPMPIPNGKNICIALVAMMRVIAEHADNEAAIDELIIVLEQSIINLKAPEGPKRT
jgi:hypothetical protein